MSGLNLKKQWTDSNNMDFELNAKSYLEKIRQKISTPLPEKDVYIPFHSVNNSSQQVLLNPALDATAIDPRKGDGSQYKAYPLLRTDAVITADGCKTELIRRPTDKDICVIDWLTITMQSSTLDNERALSQPQPRLYQSQIISNFSEILKDIFGFGIEREHSSGRNFYERCFLLEHDAGFVCIGGQADTLLLAINGTGCTYGKQGWEAHLNAWLNLFAREPKITRIDLAHDDLYGEYTSVDWFDEQHTLGGFSRGAGRKPMIEYRGDWKNPSGKGRSLYIGSRQSSKLCRIYEKGRQLGDTQSNWTRTEVQFSSKGFHIDLDVLIKPSEYFCTAYPCFDVFEFHGQNRKMERIEKQNLITFEQSMEIVRHQFGRYLYFFRRVYDDDSQLLDDLTDIENTKTPERIDPLTIPQMSH